MEAMEYPSTEFRERKLSSFQSLDVYCAASPLLPSAHCAHLHGHDSMHRDREYEKCVQ